MPKPLRRAMPKRGRRACFKHATGMRGVKTVAEAQQAPTMK